MTYSIVWGRNIRAARLQRNISQEKLARLIDVGGAQVTRWERGLCIPRDDTKRRLAEFFGVPISELFPWDDNGKDAAA